jgi:lipopolysaccharide transport system ATP-binding protein
MDAWEGAAVFEVLPTLPYPESATEDAWSHGTVLCDFTYQET